MNSSKNLAGRSVISSVSVASLVAGLGFFFVQPAFAQAAPEASSDAAAPEGETIIVTGSLIQRPDLVASSPVSVISAEQIKLNNVVTVEQILSVSPQFSGNSTSASNNPPRGSTYSPGRSCNSASIS